MDISQPVENKPNLEDSLGTPEEAGGELSLSLPARIEALLFAAPEPVSLQQLAAALELTVDEVEQGLESLAERYHDPERQSGLRVQRGHGRVQLTTAPQAAPLIERFLGLEAASRLSRAALEALAIIAYQQPVTRPQIDAIRGVNSDGVLKSLLSKGLVQEVGRAEAPGRPILYATTTEFLQYFGLDSLLQMPPLQLGETVEEDGSSQPTSTAPLKD
jgi:segregation and condensation protein B